MNPKKLNKESEAKALFLEAERYEEMGDVRSAFKHLLAAAHLGHAMGQVNLGNFYSSGKGVRRNREKATHWYKKGYENGYRDGALNLAIDKRNEGNVRSAVIWFKKAIAMNCGDAYIQLAKIYNSRRGGRKAATNLLERAIRMDRNDVSEAAKEEAESLLRTWAKR